MISCLNPHYFPLRLGSLSHSPLTWECKSHVRTVKSNNRSLENVIIQTVSTTVSLACMQACILTHACILSYALFCSSGCCFNQDAEETALTARAILQHLGFSRYFSMWPLAEFSPCSEDSDSLSYESFQDLINST